MPSEETNLSDRERAVIEEIARLRGVSFEEAANAILGECIEQRFRRGVRRAPAKVYSFNKRGSS